MCLVSKAMIPANYGGLTQNKAVLCKCAFLNNVITKIKLKAAVETVLQCFVHFILCLASSSFFSFFDEDDSRCSHLHLLLCSLEVIFVRSTECEAAYVFPNRRLGRFAEALPPIFDIQGLCHEPLQWYI